MDPGQTELSHTNLEDRLATDETLVDYFNTFLSLPCFPQRIFYNRELHSLEQFSQKLVKDEANNVQVNTKPQRIKDGFKTVQISYCATILDKVVGFKWLKKHRLEEFVKSKLYAEYKLSKQLRKEQAKYFDTIITDLERSKTDTAPESQESHRQKLIKTTNCVKNGDNLDEQGTAVGDTFQTEYKDIKHENSTSHGSDVTTSDVTNHIDVINDDSTGEARDDSNSQTIDSEVLKNGNERNFGLPKKDTFLSIKNCYQDIKTSNVRTVSKSGEILVNLNETSRKISPKLMKENEIKSTASEAKMDDKVTRNEVNTKSGTETRFANVKISKESHNKGRDVNVSTKPGMDKFKKFLSKTTGECLLLYWVEVELWKYEELRSQKEKMVGDIKDTFLRKGSPFELPEELRKKASSSLTDLVATQKLALGPLNRYWCPRFTLHHLRRCILGKNRELRRGSHRGHNRRTYSEPIPHENIVDIPSLNKAKMQHQQRPHSSVLTGQCERVKSNRLRSKSANSRIITTPYHTNAGTKQLELYATPQPLQCGFQKKVIETYPEPSDGEYTTPVRLLISPLISPKKAWEVSGAAIKNVEDKPKAESSQLPERLVDVLTFKNETGNFFKEFIQKQNNKLWKDCLSLWQSIMEYNTFFDSVLLNPDLVKKKAQWIYVTYIQPESACSVQLGIEKSNEIAKHLNPPFEDVFDSVEEHMLQCLREPWDILCGQEHREYNMVPKQEALRYLHVNVKHRKDQSDNFGFLDQYEDESVRKEQGKYGIDEANEETPVHSDGVSFESIIKDKDNLETFQKFLEKKDPKAVKDLLAWSDMETFKRIPSTMDEKRNKKAKDIRQAYLNTRYFFGPDSPATKEAQSLVLSMNGASKIKEIPSDAVIIECQKYVRCRIERQWLALYKESTEYKERQDPKNQISEAVEDIMLRRRLQRSEAAWRILNSRWVSSSRDIVALRQTLNSAQSCLAFRKFVALKGETYENDVLFWMEVQRYKDLCHRHSSEKCVKKKIQAIMECFITSSILPELQIDVPIEMAEKLIERVTSRNQTVGPYLFRETQMTVFRVLFNLWKEFCAYRSTVKEDDLLGTLDKKLQHHRMEMTRKKEASERRRIAKQEAERKKKEKEERERKDMKSVEQLVSLMTEPALFDREEEDVVLWRYSKHVAGKDRKKSILDEASSFVTFTNPATKSSMNLTNKDNSKASTVFKSHGSMLTNSLYSNESRLSLKPRSKRILGQRTHHRKAMSNSVLDENTTVPDNTIEAKESKFKGGEKSPRNTLTFKESRNNAVAMAGDGCHGKIKTPIIKDHVPEDDSETTVENGAQNVTRTKSKTKQRRIQSPALTSELLHDFTNSPEGAPLDIPLPLIRIKEPTSKLKNAQENVRLVKKHRSWDHNGRLVLQPQREHVNNFIPDVIVN